MLDYSADAAALGKNLGDDLAEGKATLPLIHAMAHSRCDGARAAARRSSSRAMSTRCRKSSPRSSAQAAWTTAARAPPNMRGSPKQALDGLADNEAVAALRGLARYAVNRDH